MIGTVILLLACSALVESGKGVQKKNGIHYFGFGNQYGLESSNVSLTELAKSGATWTSVINTWFQPNINSTIIAPTNDSPNISDAMHTIKFAHSLGLKVALKPHVDLTDDPNHWRGEIGINFNHLQWVSWFNSYKAFILTMLSIADKTNPDLFIIGTELTATEGQDSHWRTIISLVRELYNGEIVYGSNHADYPDGFYQMTWWDAVDFIGIDAYYPLSTTVSPSLTEVESAWNWYLNDMQNLGQKWNKSILFTEIGYESRNDTALHPWASNGALDIEAQTICYQALYNVVFPLDWFSGVFWWAWTPDLSDQGLKNLGFTPHNKPSEQIIGTEGNFKYHHK